MPNLSSRLTMRQRADDRKYTLDIGKYLNRQMKLKKSEVFDVVEA